MEEDRQLHPAVGAEIVGVAADNESVGAGPNRVPASAAVNTRFQKKQQTLVWSRVHPSGACVPPPRSGAASVVVQGRLYMFGGYGGGTGRLDDFYSFNFETGKWEEVQVLSVDRPGCRENNGVVISDSSDNNRSIYLFGGYNGSSWLNDLWKFDIDTRRWTCIQDSSDPQPDALGDSPINESGEVHGDIPSRRFGYVSVVHNNKLVLFGGFDGSRWLNDMYVFDFKTKVWSEIQARGMLPSVRSCPAWAKDSTHVYIQGGYDGVERKADFFACDLTTYTWTQMPCHGTPPSPRYFHSCCLYGNKMYLYGGYSGNERLADMYAYDFETNHWSEIDCTQGDAPSGRSSLVAQVYENFLFVFGGYNGSMVLNDFYKFRLKPISLPPSALVNDFRKLVNNVDLADVRFIVENKDVFAHKAILAIRSEYFRVMLHSGGMRESMLVDADAENEKKSTSGIPIQDVSHAVFVKVLEFLYTDEVGNVPLELAVHLLIASERFMLDRLKAQCEDIIQRGMNVDNAISILVASHRHNAKGLKDISLDYILRNLNEPTVSAGLAELKAEPDLLLEIIKRSYPVVQSTSEYASGQPPQPNPAGPFGGGAEWNARR